MDQPALAAEVREIGDVAARDRQIASRGPPKSAIHGRLGLGHPWPRTPPGGDLPVTDCQSAPAYLALELLALPARFPTSRRRRDRLCNSVARQLEREGELELALALYCDSGTHPARERAARVLENLGEERAALEAAQEALADPWCEEERDAMGRIATRLARKLGVPGYKRRRDDFAMLDLQVPRVERGVERAAAQCLVGEWRAVYYVENQLMNALFGLAFWEEIFAPVAGAFTNPFQSAPADMYEAGFREARSELLEARFAQLAGADLGEVLPRAHAAYCDYQCRWVNWRAVDAQLVAAAAAIIPAQHLLAIWRRMLFDPRENRRGFPDLLALGEAPGDYRMIEVKGPGDTLQESQKRWLRYFDEQSIPAAVARVSWCDE
ncbi:VRR-NUC domain-containing protein [Mangrovimicrobium sediminis]|uniref:phosphodiesterase I n=1 Tax=Mangrovimicrobium sediminis TaxID=2562682 RepID=A0A4Z0LZA1_9GAMM|nr:VRR-NUC domain-containing protein [Haliea sp. SAOS-164]